MSIPFITNCPNCGAPIDRSRDSCEYCGTPYPWKPELVMEVQIEANKNSDKLIKELIDRDRLLLDTVWFPILSSIVTILLAALPFIL